MGWFSAMNIIAIGRAVAPLVRSAEGRVLGPPFSPAPRIRPPDPPASHPPSRFCRISALNLKSPPSFLFQRTDALILIGPLSTLLRRPAGVLPSTISPASSPASLLLSILLLPFILVVSITCKVATFSTPPPLTTTTTTTTYSAGLTHKLTRRRPHSLINILWHAKKKILKYFWTTLYSITMCLATTFSN